MNCGHDADELILFQANELEEQAHASVSERLSSCAECQHELEAISQFSAWQAQPVEFDMAAVTAARARAYSQIGGSLRVRWQKWTARVRVSMQSLAPVPQFAMALLLVVIGFSAGKFSSAPGVEGSIDLAEVRDIEIDANTGSAMVSYDDMGAPSAIGGLDDPSIRTGLRSAMGTANNTGMRLSALRTVSFLAMAAAPDSALVGAIASIIREDQNDAVRLRAIWALEALYQDAPVSAAANAALLDALVSPAGDGVRIAALHILMRQDLSRRDSGVLRQASETDENSYVRAGAASVLEKIESVPLESFQ